MSANASSKITVLSTDPNPDDRKGCKKPKIDEEDRISSLPEAILGHILSRFPTKTVVQTSILSKRWRYVWTSVHNLDFSDDLFFRDLDIERNIIDVTNCFRDFVNRVLELNTVKCIHTFRLDCSNWYDLSSVNSWIDDVIRRDVEIIDMNIDLEYLAKKRDGRIKLPHGFFASKTLSILKLDGDFFLDVPELVYFPNLKILHLIRLHYFDDDSVKNLISSCPVLEELDLMKNPDDNVQTLYIISSTLKKLKIRNMNQNIKDFVYKIVIESPNIQYLYLTDYVTEDYNVNFLSSVVKVDFNVEQPRRRKLVKRNVYSSKLIGLLRNVSNTKDLHLCFGIMEAINHTDFANLPTFLNLTRLEVVLSDYSWECFSYLLECTPKLRTLLIGKMHDDISPCECQWESPRSLPICLSLCLEEIVITEFEACDDEMEMVKYLLENGRVLKKMMIETIKLSRKGKLNIRKELLKFSKASPTCKFSFS